MTLLRQHDRTVRTPTLSHNTTLNTLVHLRRPGTDTRTTLAVLTRLSPTRSNRTLRNLLTLTHRRLTYRPTFVTNFDDRLGRLDRTSFVGTLPSLHTTVT